MPSPPDVDDVRKALELAEKRGRTPEDTAFLKQVFADYLQPRVGEDPSAHAARLPTPQLFGLYRRLRSEPDIAPPGAYALTPAEPPTPVAPVAGDHEFRAARLLSERTPAASSHNDFVDTDEMYPPVGHQEVSAPHVEREAASPAAPAEGPRSAPRRREHARAAEESPGKHRSIRRRVTDFVPGHKLAASLLAAAVAIAGGSYGTMYFINYQAQRETEPVRQMQQRTGKAAEGISSDPSSAPVENRARPASPSTPPGR